MRQISLFLFVVLASASTGSLSEAQDVDEIQRVAEKLRQDIEKLAPIEKLRPDVVDLPVGPQPTTRQMISCCGRFRSIQVNLDWRGQNIVGDAANEPSLAVDPNNPNRIAIGFRHFQSIAHENRLPGYAFTADGGRRWSASDLSYRRGSDPVLDYDADGNFHYVSLRKIKHASGRLCHSCDMFKSANGGMSWGAPVLAYGGDKQWMAIDRTAGPGHGNIYLASSRYSSCYPGDFTRSFDGGVSFTPPIRLPWPFFAGTTAVGPNGELYLGTLMDNVSLQKSDDVHRSAADPSFSLLTQVNIGGSLAWRPEINPGGGPVGTGAIGGQLWVATDHSHGPHRGNVYMLASVVPENGGDPMDVMFVRSTDGGQNWSEPRRINTDPPGPHRNQWFGTMSVAPNGRIDVIWNDTRCDPNGRISQLYYSASFDGGQHWTRNRPISQPFDPRCGYPVRSPKLGDYYDMISDNFGMHIAYTATFNGEQDVYYLRVPARW